MTMRYSVVIPLKDEKENIEGLIEELEPVMQKLHEPWELICIDDGSTDGTLELLRELSKKTSRLKILSFSKNFGQSSAFEAGFEAASGEFLITLDGDGQNDPGDIPKLVREISECDLVCGQRLSRKDSFGKRLISKGANLIRSRILNDQTPDTGCSLKIYRASCLKKIKLYDGMHRFFPALFLMQGFRVKHVTVNHRPRLAGKTKYHLWNRSWNTIFDLFAVYWMRRRQIGYQVKERLGFD